MLKSLKTTLMLTAALLFSAASANAGLIASVNDDQLEHLDISWQWNPETTDTSAPELTYWDASLNINQGDPNTIKLRVTHTDDAGTGVPTLDLDTAFRPQDFGLVVDSKNLIRRGGADNQITFAFVRSENPALSTLNLVATRVTFEGPGPIIPEPASLALMGLGMAAMFARRRAKVA